MQSPVQIDFQGMKPREAFNHAFAARAGDPHQEERAHRIAWAAIKRSYVKVGGSWIGRDRT